MQQHEPGEYQFHTFHSREEKIQPGKLIYHPLNVILAVLSLLYGILLSLNASWSAGFIFLSLIDILIINSAFFYLMSIGKKRIENKKKGLFFRYSFYFCCNPRLFCTSGKSRRDSLFSWGMDHCCSIEYCPISIWSYEIRAPKLT